MKLKVAAIISLLILAGCDESSSEDTTSQQSLENTYCKIYSKNNIDVLMDWREDFDVTIENPQWLSYIKDEPVSTLDCDVTFDLEKKTGTISIHESEGIPNLTPSDFTINHR